MSCDTSYDHSHIPLFYLLFILNQQFITWDIVIDHQKHFYLTDCTSAFTNSHSSMDLPHNMGMDIDDFVSRNVNNYNNVRDYFMTSNKTASRTVSMSSSETLVNYATRIE